MDLIIWIICFVSVFTEYRNIRFRFYRC